MLPFFIMDRSEFFDAFAEEDLLTEVFIQTGASAGKTIYAKYAAPDGLAYDGVVQSTDRTLRYRLRDVNLSRGDVLEIDGKQYKIGQHPRAIGDGCTYLIATLENYQP